MQDFVLDTALVITATVMVALIRRDQNAAIEAANFTNDSRDKLEKMADKWNVSYKKVKNSYKTIKRYGKKI